MTIKLFMEQSKLTIAGIEEDEMLEIMRETGAICRLFEDNLEVYNWTLELARDIQDIIILNHDVINISEDIACYNTIITLECEE